MGEFDCASEVTGIQFNAQLKQVATSHHSSFQNSSESRAVIWLCNTSSGDIIPDNG